MRDVYEIGDMVEWDSVEGGGCGVVRRVEPATAPIRVAGVTIGDAAPCSARRYRIERMDGRVVVKSHFEVTMA
ncbi:hypothetical protein G5B40_18925 [Pikeienuella piscinae]|uniref:Hypervirulence associated protein TUDOR domain-containing protein n=1 Tax=Pikeienuella piscinae TaxID=2748098 RepID=A0A7M3T5Q3_9RHOB|nr:hypothetical protein [Pikeienuella piscinae]QIE57334.1 hypothetical protein G5B40_18925 [Pikeienuella piscinae]